MDLQSLTYALTQVVHNFGAVAVLGGAVGGRSLTAEPQRRRLAWLVLGGWVIQGTSGAAFGAISYAYYGQLPDIHGIAVAALLLKMACAALGFLLAAWYLKAGAVLSNGRRALLWNCLLVLAAAALTAAAFLRWFS